MLWRLDTPRVLPDEQLSQKLMLHLRYARISTLLVQIQSRQQCYMMTTGCADCRHDRCQPGCHTQLLRRILHNYGLNMQPVPQGLAARPYTQLLLALPMPQAQLPTALDLAAWPEARLQLTWSMSGQQLRLALLLALTAAPDNALDMLRRKGWRALQLPRLFVQHYATRPQPGHIPITARLSRLTTIQALNIMPVLPQGEIADGALPMPWACPHVAPETPGHAELGHLPECETMPAPGAPLACTATDGSADGIFPDFSSAYERLLALSQASQLRVQEVEPMAQHTTGFSHSHRDGGGARVESLSAHPDALPLSFDPSERLPFSIQQLEDWASILTSEATLHEGRPGRAGLAASRLAWALGVPMRTARMLMVWLDDAHMLDRPSNPLQTWNGPRPLITRDATELLRRLQATPAPDEERVQMAYTRVHGTVVRGQEAICVGSHV